MSDHATRLADGERKPTATEVDDARALLHEWLSDTDWDGADPHEGQRANAVHILLRATEGTKTPGRAPVLTLADVRRLQDEWAEAIYDWRLSPSDDTAAALKKAHEALDAALVAWDAERQRLAADAERGKALDEALAEMDKAYDAEVFVPLPDSDVKRLVAAMVDTDVPAPSDRLHASWGRHLVAVIRRRAQEISDAARGAA